MFNSVSAKFVSNSLQKQYNVTKVEQMFIDIGNDSDFVRLVISGNKTLKFGHDLARKVQSSQ